MFIDRDLESGRNRLLERSANSAVFREPTPAPGTNPDARRIVFLSHTLVLSIIANGARAA
jgi:hypothetical protein